MVDVLLDKVENFPGEAKVKVPKKAELVIGGEKIDPSAWLLPTKQVGRYGHNKATQIFITEEEDCFLLRNC